MGAFKRSPDETLRAPETLVLSSNHFSPKWRSRPTDNVAVGIRPLSSADDDYCRSEAARIAWRTLPGRPDDEHHEQRIDVFNDAVMRIAIARAVCDPNDATRPAEIWQGVPEETVGIALTREGVKAIYDAIERVTIALSPVRREATDEEIELLAAIVHDRLSRMPEARAARVRRLAGFLLDECREHDPVDEAPADTSSAA